MKLLIIFCINILFFQSFCFAEQSVEEVVQDAIRAELTAIYQFKTQLNEGKAEAFKLHQSIIKAKINPEHQWTFKSRKVASIIAIVGFAGSAYFYRTKAFKSMMSGQTLGTGALIGVISTIVATTTPTYLTEEQVLKLESEVNKVLDEQEERMKELNFIVARLCKKIDDDHMMCLVQN